MELFLTNITDLSSNLYFFLGIIITLFGGLYIIYRQAIKHSLDIFEYFDKYFLVVFVGFILARISWIVLNYSTFSEYVWRINLITAVQNPDTLVVENKYLYDLPWRFINFSSGDFYYSALFISAILYSIYYLRYRANKFEVSRRFLRIVVLAFVPLVLFLGIYFSIFFDATELSIIGVGTIFSILLTMLTRGEVVPGIVEEVSAEVAVKDFSQNVSSTKANGNNRNQKNSVSSVDIGNNSFFSTPESISSFFEKKDAE
jgi:hypothetical protein